MAGTKKSLPAKIDLAYRLGFGYLCEICPKSLAESVLADLDKLSRRIRLLPAAAAVYFTIAMSLWRELPLEEVLKVLADNINFFSDGQSSIICPGKSSISRARTKLGSEVMRKLAERVIGPIASAGDQDAWYKGMRLMSLDSSAFDLPDEAENSSYFGYPDSSGGDTVFPQARIISLAETGTHIVTAAEIGPSRRCEQEMAGAIIEAGKLSRICCYWRTEIFTAMVYGQRP
jgi:hypothetical protein